ncbi:UbiA family prenyltransferase [Salinarimonas soli]|uniref:UbiA family prenyltransferase n=1 Tax=Salinarimonas soli TaxID=1638099 RepID=A0A5B2VS85_9HYPH|nr:UbiA family prenyltransferase [Salinarimonas soli]KAA2242081.1 UbiA family prenyltransferase [Salinarimonas soli]
MTPDLSTAALARPRAGSPLRVWLKQLRVHQYAKNALIAVPLVTAQEFTLAAGALAALAFVAFSLCASAVYVINDLVDLEADRAHPTKRDRPLASGALPLAHGFVAVPVLLLAASFLALAVSPAFLGLLAGYLAVNLVYSLHLKRQMLVDVVTLALLYAARVLAGAIAVDVEVSKWLLAFSLLIFTSLALVKRYVELATRLDRSLPEPENRDYRTGDLPVIAALAAASGFNAVTIFALYVSSDGVAERYARPDLLWLICPALIYWLARVLMLAHRRRLDDDPILFALKDPVSWGLGIGSLILVLSAA